MLLGLCAVAAIGSGCGDKISDKDLEFVTLGEVRALVQDKPGAARVVDSRTPEEFSAGRIPGAVNIQMATVSDRKDSIDPALQRFKTLVVYGRDPGDGVARGLAKRFMRTGHKNVKLYSGGIAEWTRAGMTVEKDQGGGAAPVQAK